MDVSYLMTALSYVRTHVTAGPEVTTEVPWQYVEALDWIMQYVDDHWDSFDAILDAEAQREEEERYGSLSKHAF